MPFTRHERYHAHVLAPTGRFLGSLDRDAWMQTLDAIAATERPHVVVDLSKTDFMDSSGIGLLTLAARRLRAAGGEVRLAGMQVRVHGLMRMTRLLGGVFEEDSTVEEALRHLAARREDAAV